jgi:hypothetical protein
MLNQAGGRRIRARTLAAFDPGLGGLKATLDFGRYNAV